MKTELFLFLIVFLGLSACNPSYPGFIAFKRGPQVLAMDFVFNSRYKDVLPVSFNKDAKFVIKNANNILPKEWIGKQAYSITSDFDKNSIPLILVPFADAGQLLTKQQVWIDSDNVVTNK